MSDKVQRVAELMAAYMNANGGPVDIGKAISHIRKKGVSGSDEELRNLIRQTSVVEKNPIKEAINLLKSNSNLG